MSEKKLSEELRESQASKWTQLVNPYAWADRAAALETEIQELRRTAAENRNWREAHAELRARVAEAVKVVKGLEPVLLNSEYEALRAILAPEGEES